MARRAQEQATDTMKQAKRQRAIKYETKDWRWLLWDSDLARDKIHPELGAGWTAVLKEACCVSAGAHKDKVERLREDGDRGPLRLWHKDRPFKDMVVTVPLLEWCVRRKYKPNGILQIINPAGRAVRIGVGAEQASVRQGEAVRECACSRARIEVILYTEALGLGWGTPPLQRFRAHPPAPR